MSGGNRQPNVARVLACLVVSLALAACSGPRAPDLASDGLVTVELDGFTASIDMAEFDESALSEQRLRLTTHCADNVAYSQVVVPLLGFDGKRIAPYVDVFWLPRDWNGRLALFAHGYVPPSAGGSASDFLELVAADPAQLESIDLFLCAGNALGVSSYSARGYAVQQGIAETHLMNAVFPIVFWRRPSETYVFGSSLGGLITVALAEGFPRRYDGAMPLCGPLGGSLAEFAYIGNARLLFDTAFPGVLAGSVTAWQPPDPDWVDRVIAAVAADPQGFAALANTVLGFGETAAGPLALPVVQTPATNGLGAGPDDASLAVNAVLHALRYSVEGGGDAMARGGGSPFSNASVTYGPLAPGPHVADAPVLTSDARAVAYYTRYYQPNGDLRVPTLALHGPVDPDVPTAHEALYRATVAARLGAPRAAEVLRQYLVTGYVPDDVLLLAGGDPASTPIGLRPDTAYGHCNFRPADLLTAFGALTERVRTGSWQALDQPVGSRFAALP